MRNFLQSSNVIHVTAPYALATGDGCLVGALFGMATGPVANGAAFDMLTTGVFSVAAASAATAAVGAKAYWDNSARNISSSSAAGPLVGVFTEEKTAGQVFATVGLGVYVEGSAASATESLSGPRTITALDDQKVFTCTTALTITVPELLSPRPSFIVNAPPTGNVSLDPTGAAQLNGATTTLTRSRANNPAGFVVTAYAESDGYGVSGS